MKSATIYERGARLFIHSSSKTTAGLWIISPPVLIASKEDSDEVGRSIKLCLEASIQDVPHPTSFKNLFDPVLELAGVKSFNTFLKSAKCVEVEMVGKTTNLIPTRNGGTKEGFVPLPGKAQMADGTVEALGSAAVAALALAE